MLEKEIVPAGEIFNSGNGDLEQPAPGGDPKFVQFLVPAVIAAIQLAAGIGQNVANRKFAKEQQAAQQEYDSPVNQVKRLEAAGINPALALGSVSTGNFGQSPAPLQGLPELVGTAGAGAFNGVNSLMQLKRTQLDMEAMQERVRQLKLSNDFAESSMGDRLRLVFANLLSADQTNDLRQFDLDFAKWYNTTDDNLSAYVSLGGVDQNYYGLSPRQVEGYYNLQYPSARLDKVRQDYDNAVLHGDYLGAQILGAELGNSRQQIALDFERNAKQPWGQTRPLDRLINFVINGLMTKYGDRIMQKLYGWLDRL